MAMIGSASRASRGNTMSGSSTDDNPPARPRPRNARGGGGGESEGSEDEVTERGSEVCQIGDDMCTVPSELFNLPSLKGVLSLNTWNYCLTEEERESLALHLPPIEDEEVFKDTIRDLLGGEIFHFTSPMADLFDRLKGGLCHPRVSRYREGLKYLQRKEHYHVLRRYHNHMVSLFVEMQKQWENCPDADIDERLEIWDRFQTEPLPLPKPKRVVRKPGTVRRVKASVEAAPQRRIPEVPLKMKAIELPKKGKFLIKGRSEVGALAPLKKKPAVLEPATGSKGVLKIKTLVKDRPEAPSKRIVDIDKVERVVEQEEPVRVSKPRPKGVLKLMPKGKNVLKKIASVSVKGKAPVTEIKREEVNDVLEEEFEEEHLLPFETEILTSSLEPYIPVRETFEEKRSKHKSSGESKKRKVIDIGGGTMEGEVIVKKKKKKQSRESKDQHVPLEMPEAPVDELPPLEVAKPPVEKGKRSGEPKKKPHRKKKIEEITKEPEVIIVEENRAVEDDFRPSDEVDEKPFDLPVDEDQVDQVKEELGIKPKKRTKKKPKAEVLMTSPGMSSPHAGSPPEKTPGSATKSAKKPAPMAIPTLASTFPFSVMHLLSAVRTALITNYGDGTSEFHDQHDRAPYARERLDFDLRYATSEGSLLGHSDQAAGASGGDSKEVDGDQRPHLFRGVPFSELVSRVHENPGDHRILETVEPLQDLVRGALKIMGSKVAPAGTKGWKPLVCFDKEMRTWSWIGPPPVPVASSSSSSQDVVEVQVSAEAWGIPQKSLLKLEDMFASWLKHGQETLQQIDQLPLPPPPLMPGPVDEKERFRDLRAQKSLMTIAPSSEDMRTYFRRQELVRYSLPDRAFAYTTADGGKSVVAPLRRGGGKPTSKARDHFMLKPDRPPHVTILCLVRDAAARLPGSIGTRADVCALIRDSQFIMEDVSDAQVNQVVSGALDRLHYERDPCVRFDGDRKLWVYLHTEREEEDFEDDGTSSTKRWKKPKKDNAENSEHCAAAYEIGSPSGADDPSGTGLMDLHSPDGMGGSMDNSAIYSVGRTELVYNKSSSLTSPRVLGNGLSRQDDGDLPFITLPPGIDSGHPMGWEGINTQASWDRDTHLQSQESLGSEDEYYMEGAGTAQRHAEAMFNADTE